MSNAADALQALFGPYNDNGPAPAKKGPGYIGTVRTDALTDIFNQFASDALRDFPKLRGGFLLTDGKTGEAIGDVAPGKLNMPAEKLALELAEQMYAEQPGGGYADTIMLNPSRDQAVIEGEIYSIRYNKSTPVSGNDERDLKFVLRHELGHAVVPGGLGAPGEPGAANYAEKVGDLLATLMDIKEYGDDDFVTLVARFRSETLLKNYLSGVFETAHFTNQALTLFEAQKSSLDIKNMSPEEMTATAASIAAASELTPQKKQGLGKIVNRATRRYASYVKQTGNKDFSVYLAAVVMELLEKDVTKTQFDMGLEIVRPFLKEVPGHPSLLKFNSAELAGIRQDLEAKSKTVQDPPKNYQPQTGLKKSFPYVEHLAKSKPQQPQKPYGEEISWDELKDIFGGIFGKKPSPQFGPQQKPGTIILRPAI